jgi:hypothetical protein
LRYHYGDGVSGVGGVGGGDRGFQVFTIGFLNGDDRPPPPSFLSIYPNAVALLPEKCRCLVTAAALLAAFFSTLVVVIDRRLPEARDRTVARRNVAEAEESATVWT